MKGIEIKAVEEIKEEVTRIKKYLVIWNKTMEIFSEDEDRSDILSAIEEKVKDSMFTLSSILEEGFENWSGIAALRDKGLSPWGDTSDEYHEAAEEIRERHTEISDVCYYMVANEEIDYFMGSLPIDFMQAFIEEYGLFEMNERDVRIL